MATLKKLTTDYFARSDAFEPRAVYTWNKSLQQADADRLAWLHTEPETASDMTRDAAEATARRRAAEFGLCYVVVVNPKTGNHTAVTAEGWNTKHRAECPDLRFVAGFNPPGDDNG